MAKATDAQIKTAQEQLAKGETPTDRLRINFGDAEPIQAVRDPDGGGVPSLSGKTRAQLEAIAVDEGVDISEATTNADIATAIEAARNQE